MVIKNAYIITMDENKVIRGGYIVTEGRKITYVGDALPTGIDTGKVIDARGGIVLPGLVNAHTHTPMSIMRGYADDMSLYSWLYDKIFPAEERLDQEAIYYGSLLSCAEMIKSGTTSFSDMYFMSEYTVKAAIECGIKANIAPCITGMDDEYRDALTAARSLFARFNGAGGGNIKIDYALHAVYTCGRSAIAAVADAAALDGALITVHISETQKENDDCAAAYSKTPTELLYEYGAISERTSAAHCVYLTDSDMDIFASCKAKVVHNPTSNLKLASGMADIKKMLKKNISVAIGTDGPASNNSLNMFAETKLAALLAKGKAMDPQAVSAYQALFAATRGGAMALGRDSSQGMIRVGHDADLIILSPDAPNMCPLYDPVSAVVYAASGGEVDTSIISGEIVMEHGELLTIDMEKIKREVRKTAERIGL